MFWENFVELCSQNGISPNAVAAQLGKSSGSVTAWKNGVVPRETTLKRIADYFGVTVDRLIYEQKEKPTLQTESERIPGYSKLSETNRAIVDSMIAQLLAAQSED